MREIIYRAKRKDNGEWVYGVPLKEGYSQEVEMLWYEYSSLAYTERVQVIPETVGQYTGLNDKNGKKIFEGDIIKSCEYDEVYYVKYFVNDSYPAFDVVPEMNIECNGLSHLYIVEGIEVIGNIHDNPELIEVVRK